MEDNLLDSNEISASKKIAMLEMKSVNDSQKAEHASKMYEYQKKTLRDLEDRNQQLEDKFSQVGKHLPSIRGTCQCPALVLVCFFTI